MVPTVERGLRDVDFWSIETAGERPSMKSTSGLSICPRNCRAYDDSDSTYRRCPSAKIVSNARLDLPDPDKPVNTIKELRGRSRLTSRRLCSRAPRMIRRSDTQTSLRPERSASPTTNINRMHDQRTPWSPTKCTDYQPSETRNRYPISLYRVRQDPANRQHMSTFAKQPTQTAPNATASSRRSSRVPCRSWRF